MEKTALAHRLLARLDLHCIRVDLADARSSQDASVPLWCSGWHQHFLHEFPSLRRAVFLAYDRELVPDGKVLG